MWSTTLLDLFSRFAVGWMVALKQSGELASRFVRDAISKQDVAPGTLIAHQDRGAPMTSRSLALTYADLGVVPSFSRPRVSNDNPFSESQFKTAKCHPTYPEAFIDVEHARTHFDEFFRWYNDAHRHGGLAYLTPADVHFGRTEAVVRARQTVLDAAFAAHPERFPRGRPHQARPPAEVWINPPLTSSNVSHPTREEPTETEAGRADLAIGGTPPGPPVPPRRPRTPRRPPSSRSRLAPTGALLLEMRDELIALRYQLLESHECLCSYRVLLQLL